MVQSQKLCCAYVFHILATSKAPQWNIPCEQIYFEPTQPLLQPHRHRNVYPHTFSSADSPDFSAVGSNSFSLSCSTRAKAHFVVNSRSSKIAGLWRRNPEFLFPHWHISPGCIVVPHRWIIKVVHLKQEQYSILGRWLCLPGRSALAWVSLCSSV